MAVVESRKNAKEASHVEGVRIFDGLANSRASNPSQHLKMRRALSGKGKGSFDSSGDYSNIILSFQGPLLRAIREVN